MRLRGCARALAETEKRQRPKDFPSASFDDTTTTTKRRKKNKGIAAAAAAPMHRRKHEACGTPFVLRAVVRWAWKKGEIGATRSAVASFVGTPPAFQTCVLVNYRPNDIGERSMPPKDELCDGKVAVCAREIEFCERNFVRCGLNLSQGCTEQVMALRLFYTHWIICELCNHGYELP